MSELAAACDELAGYLPRLEQLITDPTCAAAIGRSPTASSPPWNTGAANVALDVHEGAPRLEASIRRDVTGHLGPRRGGSDGNTVAALHAVGQLGHALPDPDASTATRIIRRWTTAARRLPDIDEAPVWRPIRGDGDKMVTCKYCGHPTLRYAVASHIVMCFFPPCTDLDGNRPQARMEPGRYTAQPCLAWSDGTIQAMP